LTTGRIAAAHGRLSRIPTRYQWPWLGPPLTTLQCAMYFWFCGSHQFVRNRPGKRNINRGV